MHAQNVVAPLVISLLALSSLSGMIALISPRAFACLSMWSTHWVDSYRYLAVLDRRFDIDHYVLRHCRLLGALVLLSVSILTFLWVSGCADCRFVTPTARGM